MAAAKKATFVQGRCSMRLEATISLTVIVMAPRQLIQNFCSSTFFKPKRRQAENPEPPAFEGKLRKNEARGKGGKGQRRRREIQIADHRLPVGTLKVEGHIAQVQHINAEQPEEDHELNPLRRVAPEQPRILEHQRRGGRGKRAQPAEREFQERVPRHGLPLGFRLPLKTLGSRPERDRPASIEETADEFKTDEQTHERIAQEEEVKECPLPHQSLAPGEHRLRQPCAGQEGVKAQPGVMQKLIEREHLLLRNGVGVGDRLHSEGQQKHGRNRQKEHHSFHTAPGQDADEENDDPRTGERRENRQTADRPARSRR